MKLEYICENCGYVTSKWYGRCPQCDEWNSFTEREDISVPTQKTVKKAKPNNNIVTENSKACKIKDISFLEKERTTT
ncbi:MAG: DNA repair protein RadA, partial [Clostridia bacterium]|nr:DNA repair protein RadA [Clostridia bacterium]